MKRILSLILAFVLAASLLPAVHASENPAVSSNIDDHWYINVNRWTDPIKSTLAAEGGGYVRVEYIGDRIVVEHYDADLNYVSGQELAQELPVYGGVYICEDYNFVVTGQNNTEEDDSKEVFRITRYTKDWVKVDHASLFGANTVYPFDAGTVRFDRSGDMLYIRTSHEMYTSDDGLNHQANVMIAVRISDMTVTDELTKVWNLNYGYVSHSFNQFVRVDGETLLAVDHGDYYPRSVVLIKYGKRAGEEEFYSRVSYVNALNIVDSTYHYNDTGVSVGGFEVSSSHYLIAGSSYDQTESADLMNVHRNIFVTATPKDDFTDEATAIHWLTSYTAGDDVAVSPPHLVKVNDDRFLLTWTEDGSLKYCFVDGEGQLDGGIYDAEGALSDCVPIVDGDRALWYVTDYSAPVFYEIGLSGPHTHVYTSVVTAPTCTEQGYTTHTCTDCGHSYVDSYTDATGHSFWSWHTVQEPTCTVPGLKQRECVNCDLIETEAIPAEGHSYTFVTTPPTCTEQGYVTMICTGCGDSYIDKYNPATGHSWDEGEIIQQPSEESDGLIRYTCTVCGTYEDRDMGHTHEYAAAITDPTCTEQGYTTYTCGCGHTTIGDYTAALGHSWYGLECKRCDATRENPFSDTDPLAFYFEPVLWAVHNGITTGTSATTFSPDGPCQRAQVVTFLWRAAGCPEPESAVNPFVDVQEGAFYYKAVLWAVEKGITNGLDATHFGPNAYCNRAQVVTFLYRAMGSPETERTHNPFTDVVTGDFYGKAVLWAVEKGITNGISATEFGVGLICNRAQIVTFLHRAYI